MTVYDENGNVITLEISDNESVLEALTIQNDKLETLCKSQADIIAQLEQENTKIEEMNQYIAFLYVLLMFGILYKVLGGALSAMFGGS